MKKINLWLVGLILLSICFQNIQAQDKTNDNSISAEDIALLKRINVLRDSISQIRRISHDSITVSNVYKTAGIIQELLNRSEQQIFNLLPKGRFGWSWSSNLAPKETIASASKLIQLLSQGKDPFAGKYAEPGGYTVDHALIKKDGVHHLIYIRGTAATSWPEYKLFNFGHATSTDLKNWKIEEPVLQCPATGFDTYQVWAPHIIKHKGTYYMFYTGVNYEVAQGICMATSKDLYHWERNAKNPLVTTGKWGIWNENRWSDCRDPVIMKDGNIFYMYYTAMRINDDTKKPEYCIGISSSNDLYNWKDEGFVQIANSLNTPPESSFVLKRGETYYMFYSSYKYGTVYLTSKSPVKGWSELPVDKMVLIPSVSASEVYEDNGKWYISFISHQPNDLHFFEIKELVWNKDGSVSVQAIK